MRDEKTVLGFDTATAACSVAVRKGHETRFDHRIVERQHNATLLPMIEGLLGIPRDVAAVGFGCGPGSFTGVRIAASAAQGIALGLAVPVVPVSSLAILAAGALRIQADIRCVVACIAGRRGEMYTCAFERGDVGPIAVTSERAVRIEQCAPTDLPGGAGICGDAAAHLSALDAWRDVPVIDWPYPHAQDLMSIVCARLTAGGGVDVAEALPVYLEGSGSWQKIAGR